MQMYSPAVLDALSECLRTIYWYKKGLKSFLRRAGVPRSMVQQLPWDEYKRTVANTLIDELASNPSSGKVLIDRLIDGVVEQDLSFEHLRTQDDGKRKVQDARRAVRELKDLLGKQDLTERASRTRDRKRTEARRRLEEKREREEAVKSIYMQFQELVVMEDRQERGRQFQVLLRDLFALHDLDPRGSFASTGEEIDGSIRLESTIILVEARWRASRTQPRAVRDFRGKVKDKLENTLGLFISMAGFTDAAVDIASGGRGLIVLMDGEDLMTVLQGLHDLVDLLRRKLRHAAEKGEALYRLA